MNYVRYFIWADKNSEYHIDNMITTVPNKAVIFGPEECEVAYDWGRLNILPNSIELSVVTGAANKYHLPHHSIPITAKLILWPTFWMTKTYLDLYHDQVLDDRVIDKLYMSLNVKPRLHRSMLMDELCLHDLLKHGHVSWHIDDPDYTWKYWKSTKLIIDTQAQLRMQAIALEIAMEQEKRQKIYEGEKNNLTPTKIITTFSELEDKKKLPVVEMISNGEFPLEETLLPLFKRKLISYIEQKKIVDYYRNVNVE